MLPNNSGPVTWDPACPLTDYTQRFTATGQSPSHRRKMGLNMSYPRISLPIFSFSKCFAASRSLINDHQIIQVVGYGLLLLTINWLVTDLGGCNQPWQPAPVTRRAGRTVPSITPAAWMVPDVKNGRLGGSCEPWDSDLRLEGHGWIVRCFYGRLRLVGLPWFQP